MRKIAYFTSGIRVQSEHPLDAVSCGNIAFCRLKTPIGEPSISHVHRKIARQSRVVDPQQSTGSFDFQCNRFRSIDRRKRWDGCNQNETQD